MAALWEGIYLRTGKFVPKLDKRTAEDVFALKPFRFDTGLRRMRDKETGKLFWAHSDIDIQVIARNGAPMDPSRVKQFVDELNAKIGGSELFQHGDNISGVFGKAEGAKLPYLLRITVIIDHRGVVTIGEGVDTYSGILSDGWRTFIRHQMQPSDMQ